MGMSWGNLKIKKLYLGTKPVQSIYWGNFNITPSSNQLDAPTELWIDEYSKELNWEPVTHATQYYCQIFRNDTLVGFRTVSDPCWDFSGYVTTQAVYTLKVKAQCPGGAYEDSSYSTAPYNNTPLDAPVISFNPEETYFVIWSEISGAYDYTVRYYLNDPEEAEYDSTDYTSFSILDALQEIGAESGTYTIQVRANPDGESSARETSAWSNSLTYTYTAHKLDTPEVYWTEEQEYGAEWYTIDDADYYGYKVTLPNTQETEEQTTDDYSIALPDLFDEHGYGTYTIHVQARSETIENSDWGTDSVTYQALATPVISLDGDILSWEDIPRAEQYELRVEDPEGDVYYEYVGGNSLDVTEYTSIRGEYQFSLYAVSDYWWNAESDRSNIVTYTYNPTTITVSVEVEGDIYEDEVEGAGQYNVGATVEISGNVPYNNWEWYTWDGSTRTLVKEESDHDTYIYSSYEFTAATDITIICKAWDGGCDENCGDCDDSCGDEDCDCDCSDTDCYCDGCEDIDCDCDDDCACDCADMDCDCDDDCGCNDNCDNEDCGCDDNCDDEDDCPCNCGCDDEDSCDDEDCDCDCPDMDGE